MGAVHVRRYDKNYDIEAFFKRKSWKFTIYMTDVNITAEVNKEKFKYFRGERSFMKQM